MDDMDDFDPFDLTEPEGLVLAAAVLADDDDPEACACGCGCGRKAPPGETWCRPCARGDHGSGDPAFP